jgi:hypothetical protein
MKVVKLEAFLENLFILIFLGGDKIYQNHDSVTYKLNMTLANVYQKNIVM